MKDNWVLIVVGSVVVGFVSGCVTDLAGGKPRVPLSDKNGSERIFSANEIETAAAITNALGNFRYRDLMLYEAAKSDWAITIERFRQSAKKNKTSFWRLRKSYPAQKVRNRSEGT